MTKKVLTLQTYLEEFKTYFAFRHIKGGTIHDFLKNSIVKYHRGKCPVYYIEYWENGQRAVIGGNYATNKKPELKMFEELDF